LRLLDELPPELRASVESLGQRTRDRDRICDVIVALCRHRPYQGRELATLLGRRSDYLRRQYLTPLLRDERLHYRYPDEPYRSDQAYLAMEP
jgi:ATP-dependent DNA helicase RecG